MRRVEGFVLAAVLVVAAGASVAATSVGIGVGIDPTGIWLVNALTETPISPSFDLRAEVGFAADTSVAGLMVTTASLLFHYSAPPVDPFVGVGIGAALTPPPYSSGLVLEAVAGVRVIPFEPVGLFLQGRLLARWSSDGWSVGPVYEAGLCLRF